MARGLDCRIQRECCAGILKEHALCFEWAGIDMCKALAYGAKQIGRHQAARR